jgi:phosphohistidine phosphatase
MRHAQAARNSVGGGDFERSLTDAGRDDARLIGQALKDAGLKPDFALISAARRTQETWAELSSLFPDAKVAASRDLYNAEESILRDAVAEIDEMGEACNTLLILAHNPGIHAFAVRLLLEGSASAATIDKVDNRFPTATAVAYQIDEAGRACYDGLFLAAELGGGGRD